MFHAAGRRFGLASWPSPMLPSDESCPSMLLTSAPGAGLLADPPKTCLFTLPANSAPGNVVAAPPVSATSVARDSGSSRCESLLAL
jgi:hypothetical protein